MKIRELPSEERPREKLLRYGRSSLSTAELLALLIGSGSKTRSAMDVAMEVMSMDPKGVTYLAECSPEELMNVPGVGYAKAAQILAAVEIGKRIAAQPPADRPKVRNSGDVARMFMEEMRRYKKEYFICLLMDSKGNVIQNSEVSIGDIASSIAQPREVFVDAIKRCAASVLFVHNHPSGDPTPSNEDIIITNRLIEVGDLVGIPVLDHIIIGDGCYISLKNEGYV